MTILSNNTWQTRYYDFTTKTVLSAQEANLLKRKISSQDIDKIIKNGLFSLRRPGEYNAISNLIAIPPKTSWTCENQTITFHSELRRFFVPKEKKWDEIERAALSYLNLIKAKKIAVELSGGLDTSVIIEFLTKNRIDFFLIGFTSDRWEFRTERAIQEHYLKLNPAHKTFSYEKIPSFDDLTNSPVHPLPQQESLFYKRHLLVAQATKEAGCTHLFSGEAGDQIFGFPTHEIESNKPLPNGYGYWSLSEQWNTEHIYEKIGIKYISALGIGKIPSYILSRRQKKSSDHMKLWIRNELRSLLPDMLTKYAYKGFHDGWVSDGLKKAEDEIFSISSCAYEVVKHSAIHPDELVSDSKMYAALSEDMRKKFLTRLAAANWINSLYKHNLIA